MNDFLLDTSVRAAVILLIALVATGVMRRAAAATRHSVWTLAVVSALAVPALIVILPAWHVLPALRSAEALRHQTPSESASVSSSREAQALGPSSDTPARVPPSGQATSTPLTAAQRFSLVAQRFSAATLLALWALVALALIARIVAGIMAVRRLTRHARPADAGRRAVLEECAAASGLRCSVRLLISRDIAMPMTWGRTRPVVLLPREATAWTEERLRVVLLHELAHVRRGDATTHVLGRLLTALHWFNPLSWLAVRAMTRERERACDDYVLTHGAQPGAYAQHLLDIARAGATGLPYAVAPAMARQSELEGRLLSILTTRSRERGRLAARAIPLAAAALTAAVAAATPSAAPAVEVQSVARRTVPAPPPAPPARSGFPGVFNQRDGDDEKVAVKALVGALADPSRDVRESAAMGLAMTNDREALQPLIAALEDPHDQVREKAALALGFRSESSVVDPLLAALGDESAQVREKAAMGLGFRKHPGVVDALIAAAKDEDAQVREKVILALGLSGDPRATSTIVAATKDPDSQVREKAVQALGMVNRDLDDVREAIRKTVAGALALAGAMSSIKR